MLWNSTYHHWSMSGLHSLHKARNIAVYMCAIFRWICCRLIHKCLSYKKKIITANSLFYTWSNPRILNSIDPQIINAFKTIKNSWWLPSMLTLFVHRILQSSNPYVPLTWLLSISLCYHFRVLLATLFMYYRTNAWSKFIFLHEASFRSCSPNSHEE